MSSPSTSAETGSRSSWIFFSMAVAAGLAVANLYYNQPLLGLIGKDMQDGSASSVGPATQIGYAIGLILLVPLSDLVDRRKLIVTQFVCLAIVSLLAGISPSLAGLVASSILLGFFATAAQQILPYSAELAPVATRGAMVGRVVSGLLCGILVSRTLSGFVGEWVGWRAVFLLGAPLALVGAVLMMSSLPKDPPRKKIGYTSLMRSLGALWMEMPELRLSSCSQGCMFGSFSVLWVVLALHLQKPSFGLGADAAGLFGLVGIVGAICAPRFGRLIDQYGPRLMIVIGSIGMVVAWLICFGWDTVPGLVLGILLQDLCCQASLIANQQIVYALRPEARGRLNTVFVGSMFICGAIAAALSVIVWEAVGWSGVTALGAVLALIAVALQAMNLRRSRV